MTAPFTVGCVLKRGTFKRGVKIQKENLSIEFVFVLSGADDTPSPIIPAETGLGQDLRALKRFEARCFSVEGSSSMPPPRSRLKYFRLLTTVELLPF